MQIYGYGFIYFRRKRFEIYSESHINLKYFVINVAIWNILEESLSMSYLHNLSAEKTFVCLLWKAGIAAHFPLENLLIYFF